MKRTPAFDDVAIRRETLVSFRARARMGKETTTTCKSFERELLERVSTPYGHCPARGYHLGRRISWLYHACDTIPRYAIMARHCTDTLSAVFYDDAPRSCAELRRYILDCQRQTNQRPQARQGWDFSVVRSNFRFVLGRLELIELLRGFRIQLKFGFFLHDGKANKETFGVKGAGGLTCCMACLNCGNFKANSRGKDFLPWLVAWHV